MKEFLLLFGFILGGGMVGWLVRLYEASRFRSHIRDLEARLRYAYSESLQLKEKLVASQGEAAALRTSLGEERLSKNEALARLAATFQKSLLFVCVSVFAIGLTAGGTASWFGASWHTQLQTRMEKTDLEITARLSQLRAELLEKQLLQSQKELDQMRLQLHEESVSKTVALTKLGILLESLSPKNLWEGFELNHRKLKNNLAEETKPQAGLTDYPILKHATFRP